MSIKIYNAFKTELSMVSLHKELNNIREQANAIAKTLSLDLSVNLMLSHEASVIASQLDLEYDSDLAKTKHKFALIPTIAHTAMTKEKEIKKTGLRNPKFDFLLEVIIIPVKDYFLLRLLTKREEFIDLFRNNTHFSEFEYWDNEDRPDYLTGTEWTARRTIWLNATNNERWSASGYTRELSDGYHDVSIVNLVAYVTSNYPPSRRTDVIVEKVFSSTLYTISTLEQLSTLAGYADFLASKEAAEYKQRLRAQIEPLVQQAIDSDYLSQLIK